MSASGEIIQRYLDSIRDPACFCDGVISSISPGLGPMEFGPNCGARVQCQLFRQPRPGTVRRWDPGYGTPENGCDAFRLWERDKERQVEDAREWVVTMAGETRTVAGRDAQYAAINMFWALLRDGVQVDSMDLWERRYTVRET